MLTKNRAVLLGMSVVVSLIFSLSHAQGDDLPDYSGTWKAKVQRISDNCRKSSARNMLLTLDVARKPGSTNLIGTIRGDGAKKEYTGTSFTAAFNLWKVTHAKSRKYGNCTYQQGIYVAKISNFQSKKVNYNYNVNCNKNGHHSYSCHYTYKGSANRL